MRTEAGTNEESAEESGFFFLIVAKYTGGTICCFTHSQVCSLAVLSAFATPVVTRSKMSSSPN